MVRWQRLDRRRPSSRPTSSSARVTASQAGDDDVEDCNNGADDGSEHGTNTVDNGHQAGTDGMENALKLGSFVSTVGAKSFARMTKTDSATHAGYNGTHFWRIGKMFLRFSEVSSLRL